MSANNISNADADVRSKARILLDLFLAFLKIGATTFGGGMGMLINLQREIVDRRKWLSYDELLDYVAIAQCTPGIIMVNTATLLGAKKGGFIGSLVATVAVVLPSLIIITVLASVIGAVAIIRPYISKFMTGMRIAVCAIGVRTMFRLTKSYVSSIKSFLLFVAFFIIGFSPIFFKSEMSRNSFLSFISSNASSVLIVLGILMGILLWNSAKASQDVKASQDAKASQDSKEDEDSEPCVAESSAADDSEIPDDVTGEEEGRSDE